MSSLVFHLALGGSLLLAAAVAVPLMARRTRRVPANRPVYFSVIVPALAITAAGGGGFIHLMLAITLARGLLQYGLGAGGLAFMFLAFGLCWRTLGPEWTARGVRRSAGVRRMAHPGA